MQHKVSAMETKPSLGFLKSPVFAASLSAAGLLAICFFTWPSSGAKALLVLPILCIVAPRVGLTILKWCLVVVAIFCTVAFLNQDDYRAAMHASMSLENFMFWAISKTLALEALIIGWWLLCEKSIKELKRISVKHVA